MKTTWLLLRRRVQWQQGLKNNNLWTTRNKTICLECSQNHRSSRGSLQNPLPSQFEPRVPSQFPWTEPTPLSTISKSRRHIERVSMRHLFTPQLLMNNGTIRWWTTYGNWCVWWCSSWSGCQYWDLNAVDSNFTVDADTQTNFVNVGHTQTLLVSHQRRLVGLPSKILYMILIIWNIMLV